MKKQPINSPVELNEDQLAPVVGGAGNRDFLKEADGRLDPYADPTKKEEGLQNMNVAIKEKTDTVKALGDLLKKVSSNI